MASLISRAKSRYRHYVQIAAFAITNGYLPGWSQGTIYQGDLKGVCVPGLNCYSCPGAFGACPIGALQATLKSGRFHFAFYVLGFLLLIGAVLGRVVCGWLCPFGLMQDLLHKIPLPKGSRVLRKLRKLPGDRWLRYLKYVVLVGLVIVLPMCVLDVAGRGQPWFCEFICPSGTLFAGIPLIAANPSLQAALGWLFTWKFAILLVLLLLSVIVYRPFCRYLCPLGAVYGVFNPIALVRMRVDSNACVKCGACQRACKLDIPAYLTPNSPECIRCGDCRRACPVQAISIGVCASEPRSCKKAS